MDTLGGISRRGALPALAELARWDPRPLGAMEFARATRADAGTASRVRNELHDLGIIEAKIVRTQGAVNEYEIRLTPLGRQLGPHILAMAGILEGKPERRGKK